MTEAVADDVLAYIQKNNQFGGFVQTLRMNVRIPGSNRQVDRLIQVGDRCFAMEVKYRIDPSSTKAFSRFIDQIRAGLNGIPRLANENGYPLIERVVWTARPLSNPTMKRIEQELGREHFSKIQFVEGVEGLYRWFMFVIAGMA